MCQTRPASAAETVGAAVRDFAPVPGDDLALLALRAARR